MSSQEILGQATGRRSFLLAGTAAVAGAGLFLSGCATDTPQPGDRDPLAAFIARHAEPTGS